jgi:hypothetical protein
MASTYKANLEALTEEVKQLGLVKLGDGKESAPAAGGRAAALLAGAVLCVCFGAILLNSA